MNPTEHDAIKFNSGHVDEIIAFALGLNNIRNDGTRNEGKDVQARLEATMVELSEAAITMVASVHSVHLNQPGYDPTAYLRIFMKAFHANLIHAFNRAAEMHSEGNSPIQVEFEEKGGSDA
jgi:hypothetical protein